MANWHQSDAASVIRELKTDESRGLSETEAARRLREGGPNQLAHYAAKSPWLILWEQLTALMMTILIFAAVISALLADYKDALAIGAIIILNAALGFSQEYRADKAIAALKRLTVPSAKVRRDGQVAAVPSANLVAGDILLLEAGDFVPADCRILESSDLHTQEAALTGESEPVGKSALPLVQPDLPVADRRNMAYLGTFATSGHAEAVVTETGMRTELGRIAMLIQRVQREPTPLQRRLDQLGKRLAAVVLVLVTIIFVVGLLQGADLKIMFLTAVSIGVAAVPEGLPAVVTIALTLGAQRMVKRRALIRKLPAVETLGSVTVVCTDKTGTLTENRMTATILQLANERLELESENASPKDLKGFQVLVAAAALCNNAHEGSNAAPEPAVSIRGDPTETALARVANRFGLAKTELDRALPRVGEIPFSSERKRMTTIHRLPSCAGAVPAALVEASAGRQYLAFTKGAADRLLDQSRSLWFDGKVEAISPPRYESLKAAHDDLAQRGMRVLGIAFQSLDALPSERDGGVEDDLVFVGLVGIVDPPRKEASEAVAKCKAAGIRPVMITGDHPLTARHIAAKVGIDATVPVVTGPELDRFSPPVLQEVTGSATVYARVSPEHKLKIVDHLQQRGEIVAMTGDGVNDAPALKRANIGVAMGVAGTDVARDAADMVLMDDNFATIVAAVEEGRIIYDNIRKFIRYILTTNSGEMLVMLAAPIVGLPLPLLPLQILWMNLVTDGLPALALSVEPAEASTMRRPPYRPDETIFSRGLGRHVVWVGMVMAALSLGAAQWSWRTHDPHWRTFLFTVLILSQMAHVMAIRSERQSLFQIGILSNRPLLGAVVLTVILQLALVYLPFLQAIFRTTAMPFSKLALAFVLSSVIFVAVEAEKYLLRRRDSGNSW
jgi:P-type Ca2+ transporter type 2C